MPSLPNPLIGAYWACYDNSCQTLANTPTDPAGVTGYNTIFAFQVLPNGTSGELSFDCSAVETTAQLKADIAAKRAAGICVLLTFGGAGGYLALSSQAIASTFVTSLESIISEIGPVDGLDIDIEDGGNGMGPAYPAEWTSVGQQLKAIYGSSFAVTMVPGPWDTVAASVAAAMYEAGALDAVGPQFYEQGTMSAAEMISNVADEIPTWLAAVGGNKDAVYLGFELTASGSTSGDMMSPATAVTSWNGVAPLRGGFVWNSSEENSNGGLFLKGVAPTIVGSAPAPAPTPAPTPAPAPAPVTPPHKRKRPRRKG